MAHAQDQAKRFRFPGYDGNLPKATRSHRGRGKHRYQAQKVSHDLMLFELLASVAEEVSQGGKIHARKQTEVMDEDCADMDDTEINQHSCTLQRMATRNVRMSVMEANKPSKLDKKLLNSILYHENMIHSRAGLENEPGDVDGLSYNDALEAMRQLLQKYVSQQLHSKDVEAHCEQNLVSNAKNEGCSMIVQASHLIKENSIWTSAESSKNLPVSLDPRISHVLRHEAGKSELNQDRSLKAKDDDENLTAPLEVTPKLFLGESLLHSYQPPLCGSKRTFFRNYDSRDNCDGSVFNHSRKCTKLPRPSLMFGSSNESTHLKASDSADPPKLKINITSFIVPKLSLDLPETATVANLKQAVTEATARLLAGDLHVHVLHEGKQVSDESRRLREMGIACEDDLNSLAFMLRPNTISNAESMEPLLCSSNARNLEKAWYPILSSRKKLTQANIKNMCKTGESLPPMAAHPLPFGQEEDSDTAGESVRALVVHSGRMHNNAATGSLKAGGNIGRGKRRARRPFTVTEVEALVSAVEILGTGRWREIKHLAFDKASCRTYVDLKDKWKTLVRTAQIAPHQRRGEPVPHDLLDRVLTIHNYWMEHQAEPVDRKMLRVISTKQEPI